MTGKTARYILKIHNDSASMVKVNQIVLPQECDNGESDNIVCSLKNLGNGYNKTIEQIDASSDVSVNNTTIEAGESIYVSFNVYAKEDDTLIGQEQEYTNLTLSMTFMQAEGAQEQGGGDDPVIVDDDTRYNITFKDLSSSDLSDLKSALGTDDEQRYGLYLRTSNSSYDLITIRFMDHLSPDNYVVGDINEDFMYLKDFNSRSAGQWYSRSTDLPITTPEYNNVQIISASEFASGTGINPSQIGFIDLSLSDAQLFLNLTPVN